MKYTYNVATDTYEFSASMLKEHVRRCGLTKEQAQAEDDARQEYLRSLPNHAHRALKDIP